MRFYVDPSHWWYLHIKPLTCLSNNPLFWTILFFNLSVCLRSFVTTPTFVSFSLIIVLCFGHKVSFFRSDELVIIVFGLQKCVWSANYFNLSYNNLCLQYILFQFEYEIVNTVPKKKERDDEQKIVNTVAMRDLKQ